MQSEKDKYLALEKVSHESFTIYPSIKKKALQIAKKVFGNSKSNFSKVLTYLINKEHNELFGEK